MLLFVCDGKFGGWFLVGVDEGVLEEELWGVGFFVEDVVGVDVEGLWVGVVEDGCVVGCVFGEFDLLGVFGVER